MGLIEIALKKLFLEALKLFLPMVFTTIDRHITGIAGDLSITPMSWLGGSPWTFVSNVSDSVIVPVAGIILAYLLAAELIKIVSEKKSLNEIDAFELFVFVGKLAILTTITANSKILVGGIFELGGELVTKTLTIIDTTPTSAADIAATICLTLEDSQYNFMAILIVILVGLLILIVNYAVVVMTSLIIYGRIIEIVLYCAVAPIPMATYMNPRWDIATNYIKTLVALMLQGLFIIIVLGIYIIIASTPTTNSYADLGGILTAMFSQLGWSVLLAGMLMKTGTISKSILNAH